MAKKHAHWGGLLPAEIDALGDRFTVERVSRVGDLCLVLSAQHRDLAAPVVIKALRPDLCRDESNVQRFLQVARQCSLIESEHVVRILEFDRITPEGPPYYAMERLSGGTFRDLLLLHGPPPLEIALDYAIQTCRGLAAAHRRGVMHGDLRASKLFRTYRDEGGPQVKIVDFALSQALGHPTRAFGNTGSNGQAAAPESRAPEQLAGMRSIEPPTDAWAVGLVLCQLVTGKHPYSDASSQADFVRLVAASPPSITAAVPEAPADLDEIIRCCLRNDPSERPADLAALADDLASILAKVPARSERPTQPAPAMARNLPAASAPKKGAAGAAPRRFLGAAMGSRRATGGGSYSFVGRDRERTVVEEAPFPRPRRRRKRAAGTDRTPVRSSQPRARAGRPPSSRPARVPERGAVPVSERRPQSKGERAETALATPSAHSSPEARMGPRASTPTPAGPPAARSRATAPPAAEAPTNRRRGARTPQQGSDWLEGPSIDATTETQPSPAGQKATDGGAAAFAAPATFDLDREAATPDSGIHAELTFDLDREPATPDSGIHAEIAQQGDSSASSNVGESRADPAVGAAPVEELTLELDLPPTRPPAPPPSAGGFAGEVLAADDWDLEIPVARPHPSAPPPPPSAPQQRETAPQASPSTSGASWPQPFGPYLLERRLGTGSWSEAWLARPRSGTTPAARLVIKRPRPQAAVDAEVLQEMARRHQAVDHPSLMQIYEHGVVDGVPYLAVEHIEGVDLRRLLGAVPIIGRSIPYAVTCLVVRRCALAIGALHAAGSSHPGAQWLHGDLRPSKILLSLAGDVKVGTLSPELLQAGAIRPEGQLPKFDYQCPEELTGDPLDGTADLFTLGVVLGELLLGEPIFSGRGLDVLFSVQQGDCARLRQVAAMLPGGMFDVCERALSRIRSDRFQDGAELAAALEPFESSATRPPTELLVEWVARGRKATPPEEPSPRGDAAPERSAVSSLSPQVVEARRALAEQQKEPPIRVRRASSGRTADLSFHQLIEAIATGSVGPDDEVRWGTDRFEAVREVEPLAKHLLVSAPSTQGTVVGSSAPDHVYDARQTSMLQVLTQLRQCYATGMLLARSGQEEPARTREVFLQDGRLLSVRSSEPGDLLGEYLRERCLIDSTQLARALASLPAFGGHMGNALIGLGFVDAVTVYRALRQQARDRLSAVFGWPDARVDVYLSCNPPHIAFPLDLDLTCAMLDGVLLASSNNPSGWLPNRKAQLEPGSQLPPAESSEIVGVPLVLRRLGDVVASRPVLDAAMRSLEEVEGADRGTAAAAIVVAQALQWIAVRGGG